MDGKEEKLIEQLDKVQPIALMTIEEQLNDFKKMLIDKEYAIRNYHKFDFYTLDYLNKIVSRHSSEGKEECNISNAPYEVNDIVYNNVVEYIEEVTGLSLERSNSHSYPKRYIYNRNYEIYLEDKEVIIHYKENIEECKKDIERERKNLKEKKVPTSIWDVCNNSLYNKIYAILHKKKTNKLFSNIVERHKKDIEYTKDRLESYINKIEKLKIEKEEVIPKLELLKEFGYKIYDN